SFQTTRTRNFETTKENSGGRPEHPAEENRTRNSKTTNPTPEKKKKARTREKGPAGADSDKVVRRADRILVRITTTALSTL
ncbi:hypothetical protein L195_g032544, partial [Trifolium pratense]